VAAPEWLAIVKEEIIVRLNPEVLSQIEEGALGFSDRHNRDRYIIYKLNNQELLQVLASSVGMTPSSQGAITIWTYYNDLPHKPRNEGQEQLDQVLDAKPSPILRTLMNVDGDFSQKVCQDILQHPLSDRILQAHSFIVGQISRQLITAIENYVEAKLRPFAIAMISMTAVFAWCEPIRQHLHLPDVLSDCWSMIIAAPLAVLIIWWLISKLPFQLPDLPKSVLDISNRLVMILDSRALQIVALIVVNTLFSSWLAVKFILPHNAILNSIIQSIQNFAEPYLPFAIISLRKLIVSVLGKIFFRYSFFIKLVFGRFLK
jgi:hypothetical protein